MSKLFWSRKQNITIIVAGAFVALGLFYVTKNPDFFMASVLSLQEKAFITNKWRDIAYKTSSWYVDIFMANELKTPISIQFTVSFNKDSVTIDPEHLSGQGTRTYSNPVANDFIIESIPGKNVDKSQSIILLPFTGEIRDILLSDAVVKLSDWTEQNLSIWSLNEMTSHGK